MTFKRDSDGLAETLTSPQMQGLCDALAAGIAADVDTHLPVDGYGAAEAVQYDFKPRGRTSDRAASSVVIARPDGRARQAKYGLLTRAAARAGLEVTENIDG